MLFSSDCIFFEDAASQVESGENDEGMLVLGIRRLWGNEFGLTLFSTLVENNVIFGGIEKCISRVVLNLLLGVFCDARIFVGKVEFGRTCVAFRKI